jgi:hypothetical protein
MSRLRHGLSGLTFCLGALGALVLPPRALAQAERIPFREGTHAFRRILFDQKIQPLGSVEELAEDRHHTLLIVLGETDVLGRIPEGLAGFLRAGGAALVATDRPLPANQLGEGFGIGVSGRQVRAVRSEYFPCPHYRNFDECPLVQPAHGVSPALLGGTGLALKAVATNRPSHLTVSDPMPAGLGRLAFLPHGCEVQEPNGRWERSLLPPPFAVGGTVGDGRLLVLADHSLFINDMMLQEDTDNVGFTCNCLDWLTAGTGDGQPRNRVLFVEEGALQTSFDIPLKEVPLPIPPVDALVPLADDTLHQLERENRFNEALLGLMPFEQVWVGLVVVASAALAAYGFYRLTRARHRVEPAAPLLEALLARNPPAPSLMAERHRALLGRGNLWEPARALARQFFEAAGLAPPADGRPAHPRLRVSGGWWRRRALGRVVRRLWHLAYGTRPVPVSRREFARLPGQVEEVRAALASGTLALEPVADRADRRPRAGGTAA